MPCVLYKSDPVRGAIWAEVFAEQAPEIEFRRWPECGDPLDVDCLVAWNPAPELLAGLPRLEVLFSVGAGVDQLDLDAVPESVSVVRMIEPGIVAGMVEYVTFAVLALHRNLLDYREQQSRCEWQPLPVIPASRRRVGVMGMGVLGRAVLERLASFGFDLSGWSRSPKAVPGVACYAGALGRRDFLERCEILVCLLPLVRETRGILNADLFATLPRGAALVNAARGAHLEAQALIEALDSGQLSAAILDVTEPEPLPSNHPFWRHPRLVLTPHIASVTQPQTGARAVLDNVRRHARGEPMLGQVDRRRGY